MSIQASLSRHPLSYHLMSYLSNPDVHTNFSVIETSQIKGNITSHDYGLVVVVTLVVTMILFMIFAIVGNVLVILTVIRHKGMRTRTNMFIVNLAVADILVALFNMPFSLTTVICGRWIFGEVFCQFNGFVVPLFFIVSIHTLMYISIHKFISITRPFSHTMTLKKIYMMIAATWFWGALCATVTLKGGNHVVYKKGASQCGPSIPDELNEYVHSLVITTCNYIIPLIVMSYCYYHIFREIHEHMDRIRETSNIDLENSLHQQRRISSTLFLVLACFVICWTPFIGYSCGVAFMKDKEKMPLLANPIAYWCGYMNSACNPIIYALRSPSFRHGYKEIVCSQTSYAVAGSFVIKPSLSQFRTVQKNSSNTANVRRNMGGASSRFHSCQRTFSDCTTMNGALKNTSSFMPKFAWLTQPSRTPVRSKDEANAVRETKVKNVERSHSHSRIGGRFSLSDILNHAIHSQLSTQRVKDALSESEMIPLKSCTLPTFTTYNNASNPAYFLISKSEGDLTSTQIGDYQEYLFNDVVGSDISKPVIKRRSVSIENCDVNCKGSRTPEDLPDYPLVVVDSASRNSDESFKSSFTKDCFDPEPLADQKVSLQLCISNSHSEHMNGNVREEGQWSPSSTRSLEMGRNRRRSSRFKHVSKKINLPTGKTDKPDSPLYRASREQLMKWMSQDCLHQLEAIEREFDELFLPETYGKYCSGSSDRDGHAYESDEPF